MASNQPTHTVKGYTYSVWLRYLELTSIASFMSLTLISVTLLVRQTAEAPPAGLGWIIAGGFLAALLFADFASGFVHWAADNWGAPTWPVLGSAFIRPFREHHTDAEDITRHDFVELNGNNCLVSLPTFWMAFAFELTPGWRLFQGVFWICLAWWVLGTNQFHAWAHSPKLAWPVRWLQRTRLILSREHHDVHHEFPHNRNYCITTGWMNPLLRGVRFFELLEWGLERVTGVQPMHRQLSGARLEGKDPWPIDGVEVA